MEASTRDPSSDGKDQKFQFIILFYKYHPLTEDRAKAELYRDALEKLCSSLGILGRILVGCAVNEGINGTLAGASRDNILAFTYALLDPIHHVKDNLSASSWETVWEFQRKARKFFAVIGQDVLLMESPDDFKWSTSTSSKALFPDLNIKLVKELISTGGKLSHIGLDETAQGYLTPQQWNAEMRRKKTENDVSTLLIDCRNTKEFQIGHFDGATDPQTTTFDQFPQWVRSNEHILANKKVRMYCTGGIRCEKASAYIRQSVPTVQDVRHLKGGIHKYLEEFGASEDKLWKGRNFVFDCRLAASAKETADGAGGNVIETSAAPTCTPVGRCIECDKLFDKYDEACVCTVCREPVLVCLQCRPQLDREFHCWQHRYLHTCYFSNLHRFSSDQLQQQLHNLESVLDDFAVGKKNKQRRKTIQKQAARVSNRISELEDGSVVENRIVCRSCGDQSCSGRCWGFHGLRRRDLLGNEALNRETTTLSNGRIQLKKRPRTKPHSHRERSRMELSRVGNEHLRPDCYRDPRSGVRVPPCCTRVLSCFTKAKWSGQNLDHVLRREFSQIFADPVTMEKMFRFGLIRVNQRKVALLEAASLKLREGDSISRLSHWHEAPVHLPTDSVEVHRVQLPSEIVKEYSKRQSPSSPLVEILACNKPSTVPTHPAGPYYFNSLTILVEAQERLKPQSLNPLHRTDRATSGLTLCSSTPWVTSLFHTCHASGQVKKLYIASVSGKFPSTKTEISGLDPVTPEQGSAFYDDSAQCLRVCAPVHTIDAANGLRCVDKRGKSAQTSFRLLTYDKRRNRSFLACSPKTGRNHQIRVHLQWIRFPIVGDVLYGGQELSAQFGGCVVDLMKMKAGKKENLPLLESVSEDDDLMAQEACSCCAHSRQGIQRAFTQAQLLQSGHTIQLHALRYQLLIPTRRKQKTAIDRLPSAAKVDFRVSLPNWAKNVIEEHDVEWLE